jgi:hypothetical protein
MTQQTKTPEMLTPLEKAWVELLREAMKLTQSGVVRFEQVNIKDNRVWAERVIESINLTAVQR